MKAYKTYQEAKIANPEDDIFVSMCSEFATSEHVSYVSMCGTGEGWNKCNPADYCMSVADFLADGLLLVDGDLVIDGEVRVVQCSMPETGGWLSLSSANTPTSVDDEIHILRAKALEEKEVEYEYITVKDLPIREVLGIYDSSKIYMWKLRAGIYDYIQIKSERQLIRCIAESNVFTRTIKKPDWRDEVVCTGLADAKAEYLTLNCNLKIDEAEYLARAILSGIEKARG